MAAKKQIASDKRNGKKAAGSKQTAKDRKDEKKGVVHVHIHHHKGK